MEKDGYIKGVDLRWQMVAEVVDYLILAIRP
jgi:hypothetical protein